MLPIVSGPLGHCQSLYVSLFVLCLALCLSPSHPTPVSNWRRPPRQDTLSSKRQRIKEKEARKNYDSAHKCFCRKQIENRHDSPSSALNFLTLIKFIPMSFSVLHVVISKKHLHRLNLFQFHWALVEQRNSHNFARETLEIVHSSKYSTCIVPPTCESWPLDLCMDWGFGSSISAQGVLPLTPAGSLGYQPELCSRRWSFPP